jgi:predicted dehydrogenase
MNNTRRHFLKTSAAASVAFSVLPGFGQSKTGAKHKTAIIGTGWWGMNILGEAMASGACQVVAMCDVDARQLNPAAEKVTRLTGDQPRKYHDFRELLAKEKPEVVIVGTPDHWHALATIEAVKSGAHVYVEKPIGHTVREGRAMVKAARATGRVVQVGTHRRVSPHNVAGREFIRSGKVGKIGFVRAFIQYGGGPEKPRKNIEPPKELDWDMWCGPAPLRPFNGDLDVKRGGGIHPKGFRNYLDYANGTLGDWGVHWFDQILWCLGDVTGEKWPRKVFSTGGRPIKGPAILNKEEQTTDAPDNQSVVYEFQNFTATWEHRSFAGNNNEKNESVGCYFYGTEGVFHMGWQKGWTFYPMDRNREPITMAPQLNLPDQQNIKELWADFLDAIKTGRKPVCEVEEIHYSTNMSLLGMLSYKLGRSINWDGQKEECTGDTEATRLLSREYRRPWVYPG